MTILSSTQHIFRISLAGGLALGLATLAGCGIGASDNSVSPVIGAAISGKIIGGQTPIVGATVRAYATSSTGYGVATFLEEANQVGGSGQDTDSHGSFNFAPGYTCPAGQFVYITSSGGNTGANAVNPASVLVAALGRCEDLYANTSGGAYTGGYVYINELTTVAAAYALGNFSAVSGTGAATVVQIGAPATNNAAQVGGVSTGTTTAAAGLAHAFQNAANLVNPFANTSLSGANATLPGNTGAVVPQRLLDGIANVLVACVNSDGSTCTNLFTATTLNSVAPTNTFSAMVNLAANPTLSGSAVACQNFLNSATAQTTVYTPTYADVSGVHDLAVAINYPASAFTAISFPMSGALDLNDNYYVGNATYNTASAGNPTTPVNIISFSNNGNTVAATANNTTLKAAYGLSLDSVGKGYIGNGGGSGTSALGTFFFNNGLTAGSGLTTAGVITALHSGNLKVYATAVDKLNDLWAFGVQQTNGTSNLYMSPGGYTAGGTTFVAEPSPTVPGTIPSNFLGLAIDPNQNVWTTAGTNVAVVENSGSIPSPTYSAIGATKTTSGSPATGITFTQSGGSYLGWVSSYNTVPGIQSFIPSFDTNTVGISNLTAGTVSQPPTITGTFFNEADGLGNIWVADTNSVSIQQYNTNTQTAYKFLPCAGGATTCASVFAAKPQTLSVDSAGTIWVSTAAAGSTATTATPGNVVEIIGSAAPTWPLLSLGKVGKP